MMEVTFLKTKLDETKSREGVKCLLYDASTNPQHDVEAKMKFIKAFKANKSPDGLSTNGMR